MLPALWLQALVTVPAALIISTVSLLYRYRRKGHPFASPAASAWSLLIIVVTAAPAAVALLLPRVPPAYLGVVVPASLGIRGDRLYKRNRPSEHEVWYQIITLGVRLLLDRLEQRMETDRDAWCEKQLGKIRSGNLEQLEVTASELYSRLAGRDSMRQYLTRLRSHRDAVSRAVDSGLNAISPRDTARARHSAEEALMKMLQLAWECGHSSAVVMPFPRAALA